MTAGTRVDVVVLGAGPAGLMAGHRIATGSPLSVVILEAGRPHAVRGCPVDRGHTCRGCSGVCNVISGFGGSIHYGDAVKLSRFPSGRRLLERLGPSRAEMLSERALDVLGDSSPAFGTMAAGWPGLPGYAVKDYPVASLTSAQVRTLVSRLHQTLAAHPRIDLRLRTEAVQIDGERGNYSVTVTGTGPGVEDGVIRAAEVVVAVGRRGQRWWRDQVRALGLAHNTPTPSVGLRFECPASMLSGAAAVHADFKATATRHGVKVKTFCLCAGGGGGRVKFTDYGDHTLLDGHVVPEPPRSESGAPLGNFALLAQLRDGDGEPRDQSWVESHLLAPYRALRRDRPGKPVIQWYPDFRTGTLACTSLADFKRRAGFAPSIRDYQVADLSAILPVETHAAMCAVLEELLTGLPGNACFPDLTKIGVIGLELESLWDELAVTPDMETSRPGLYACGDCTGLAQGILQAAVSGLAAAEHVTSPYRTAVTPRRTSRTGEAAAIQ